LACRRRVPIVSSMRLHTGTSGFAYTDWRGRFYPPDLPTGQMLAWYSRRLPSVEINSSFYRPPTLGTLERWAQEVPPSFVFALKAPREITHDAGLRGADARLATFLRDIQELGRSFGAVLFQLPPSLPLDLERLDRFLDRLPRGLRAAFEFRHPSWLDPRVLALLAAHRKALCVTDTLRFPVPLVATTGWGYLRLASGEYTDDELQRLVERLRALRFEDVFVFFRKAGEAKSPVLAERLARLAARLGGEERPSAS